ncbi:MAG: glycoside hydrolase/phage tail family protein [Paracoccaceae bacterium]|jgi:hypothetical protein|nr:glycoside hydrolase/phage tail family protein [Paracoccaceae bacterium]
MATILLSAAGAAIGGAVGGSVLGLSSVVIGRAIGATVGRVIDQRLMGAGSDVVEIGKLSRYRVTGASEGTAMARTYARTRVGGQVIWSTRFKERVRKEDVGGKGGGGATTKTYSYSVSLAVALGEGPILRVGRVWADGIEIGRDELDMRIYPGDADQLPDPLIEAVEGAGNAPAHRGTAYVVIEGLELGPFGNRVPQLSFEVVRPTDEDVVPEDTRSLSSMIRGVALVPGSGEYVLEPERVTRTTEPGRTEALNHNAPGLEADFRVAMRQLEEELPLAESVTMVVCWFGDDLRCGECTLRPKAEQTEIDADNLPWYVSGVAREDAQVVPLVDGRPLYGGTPTDQSVIAAIEEMRAAGKHVVFYPFILMDQMTGNTLPDPWTGDVGQAPLPWRGRITTALAPGLPGTPDRTAAAEAEVADFFGSAQPGDFEEVEVAPPAPEESGGEGQDTVRIVTPASSAPPRPAVAYTGPQDWGYRRFILHYAHVCKAAGGVDAFCIGSEMRALTQIRAAGDSFPAVAAMRTLAQEVRDILGPDCKIGYAADWSEYFGYQPADGSGDVYFHLDALWGDPAIDFVGIDNYMPLSDWREGLEHLDSQDGTSAIYDIAYLKRGVAGGEGYDWYYPDKAARDAQHRLPIEDGAHGEPWIYRYKDLRSWWENAHHERRGGVRQAQATEWVPMSKPIWFTEFGCAAVDKATNQPNKFIDPKSSESRLPWYSTGQRDELIQQQYLRAVISYWEDPANNPVSPVYGGPMLDMGRAHVWAWDTRPFPQFPNRLDLWSDGENYARGHWLNGRTSHESLAAVIYDICHRAGVTGVDVAQVYGLVRGYEADMGGGARGALQPLLLAYGVNAAEREGNLRYTMRTGRSSTALSTGVLAVRPEVDGDLEMSRAPAGESPGRVRLAFVRAGGDFETAATEAAFPGEESKTPAASEMPLVLGEAEAQGMAERWLAEGRVARDEAGFALPPSALGLGAGDVVTLEGANWRIDRVEMGAGQLVEAVRVEPGSYETAPAEEAPAPSRPVVPPVPVAPVFLDLPLMTGAEVPHAPHLAVAAEPWPGPVAVLSAASDAGYALDRLVGASATLGRTLDAMPAARPGRWDRGAPVRVRMATGGALASVDVAALLAGANLFAIGSGGPSGWELFQAAQADLVDDDTWALSLRLRGQLGTEADMAPAWPSGARVVVVDPTLVQIGLPASARGLERHFRIGSAGLPLEDPAILQLVAAFEGVGLRPYAPAHLRIVERGDGGLALTWVRRTRIDGDSWLGEDVPLGEEAERYRVRVLDSADAVLREVDVAAPAWTWSAAARAADAGAVALAVAQVSQAFGAGPYRRIELDG